MINDYQFVNQTSLGEMFGVTSHEIGKWLDALGLRENKRPSSLAHNEGYVQATPTGRALDSYYYVWERKRTVAALVEAGRKLVAEEKPQEAILTGPFECRASSEDGFEIAGGDGVVAIWVRGRENAEFLVRLLNLATRFGKLPGGSDPGAIKVAG